MLFEKFFLELIIPFTFDEEKYLDLCAEPDSKLAEYFTLEKKIAAKKLNEYGRMLLTDDGTAVVKRWRGKQNVRGLLGLHKDERCVYSIRRNRKEYRFHIEKTDVWFFKQGRAFLAIQISAENLNGSELLELKNLIVSKEAERKITYSVRRSKEKTEIFRFTMKDLTRKLIRILESVSSEDISAENEDISVPVRDHPAVFGEDKSNKIFFITLGLADQMDEDKAENFLELYRRGESGTRGIMDEIEKSFCFRPCRHITWTVSENGLSAIGDYREAAKSGENNVQFLNSFWNDLIMNTYLPLYLYYLRISEDCAAMKLRCDIQRITGGRNEDSKLAEMIRRLAEESEKNLSSEQNISKLFVEYLYDRALHVPERLQELKEVCLPWVVGNSSTDIFISYRRDRGFYLAQLLYIILRQSGKNPFLDTERLKNGRFDKQIYKAIEECRHVIVVLSPGSLAKREDEEDWMRNEITYAMEHDKTIIPVMMEGFRWEKESAGTLDGVLESFPRHEAIEIYPNYFGSAVKNLFEALE